MANPNSSQLVKCKLNMEQLPLVVLRTNAVNIAEGEEENQSNFVAMNTTAMKRGVRGECDEKESKHEVIRKNQATVIFCKC